MTPSPTPHKSIPRPTPLQKKPTTPKREVIVINPDLIPQEKLNKLFSKIICRFPNYTLQDSPNAAKRRIHPSLPFPSLPFMILSCKSDQVTNFLKRDMGTKDDVENDYGRGF